MHKLGALLCTARVALVPSKDLQQGKRAGKLQRDILFISMFTYSEKKKKKVKTSIKNSSHALYADLAQKWQSKNLCSLQLQLNRTEKILLVQ